MAAQRQQTPLIKPVFRGVQTRRTHSFEAEPESLFGADESAALPCMPYEADFCAPNTFTAQGICATKLLSVVTGALQNANVDTTQASCGFSLDAVFYPSFERTAFRVFLWANDAASTKDSALVEVAFVEGNRAAFQGVCQKLQSELDFADAAAGWGDWGEVFVGEPVAPARSFVPLPLLIKGGCTAGPRDLFGPTTMQRLADDTTSCFADVRQSAWRELAVVSSAAATAQALLHTSFGGCHAIRAIHAALLSCKSKACDVERCALHTLLNLGQIATERELSDIAVFKELILDLVLTGGALETRSVAVSIVGLLLSKADFASSHSHMESALRACNDTTRVWVQAESVLQALQAC